MSRVTQPRGWGSWLLQKGSVEAKADLGRAWKPVCPSPLSAPPSLTPPWSREHFLQGRTGCVCKG